MVSPRLYRVLARSRGSIFVSVLLSYMAPKLLSLARDLFLQELDGLPRGQDLKRKARDEGGNEAKVKRRYSNLKLAEWFASPESEQQVFIDRVKARVDGSQPTLKEFLCSQSQSSSGPGAHLELDESQDSESANPAFRGDEETQPASDGQLRAAGRGLEGPPPKRAVLSPVREMVWPHDRQPEVDDLDLQACSDLPDDLPGCLQQVRLRVDADDAQGALFLLERISRHVGYVGDDFMDMFLTWASSSMKRKRTPPTPGISNTSSPLHMVGQPNFGADSSHAQDWFQCPNAVDEMWKVLISGANQKQKDVAQPQSLPMPRDPLQPVPCSNNVSAENAQYRRLLMPLGPRGNLPNQDEFLRLASESGLYKHCSQFRHLRQGSAVIGFQIATACQRAYINVWPSSGRVHIAGSYKAIGLKFVEGFTMPDPKPPRCRKPKRSSLF